MTKLRSMTGFSSTEGNLSGAPVHLEVKSLNHRFLELNWRCPRELLELEPRIRAKLQDKFTRGTIDLKLERADVSEQPVINFETNLAVAANYYESLKTIQKTFGLNDPIQLQDLLRCPEIIGRKNDDPLKEISSEAAWTELEPALDRLFNGLQKMRETEGAALFDALSATVCDLVAKLSDLRTRSESRNLEQKARIDQKLQLIFKEKPLNEIGAAEVMQSRAAQELAILLERTDIEEELTRLEGHLNHFQNTLNEGSPAGRKLDFILQEIHREINTLGSKAQDLSISEKVVGLKVQTEQLREQVMNIE